MPLKFFDDAGTEKTKLAPETDTGLCRILSIDNNNAPTGVMATLPPEYDDADTEQEADLELPEESLRLSALKSEARLRSNEFKEAQRELNNKNKIEEGWECDGDPPPLSDDEDEIATPNVEKETMVYKGFRMSSDQCFLYRILPCTSSTSGTEETAVALAGILDQNKYDTKEQVLFDFELGEKETGVCDVSYYSAYAQEKEIMSKRVQRRNPKHNEIISKNPRKIDIISKSPRKIDIVSKSPTENTAQIKSLDGHFEQSPDDNEQLGCDMVITGGDLVTYLDKNKSNIISMQYMERKEQTLS
eukprot:UN29324